MFHVSPSNDEYVYTIAGSGQKAKEKQVPPLRRRVRSGSGRNDKDFWFRNQDYKPRNLGTSMISKSQEETEVSWHLEESTRSGSVAVKLANGVRSLSAAKVA